MGRLARFIELLSLGLLLEAMMDAQERLLQDSQRNEYMGAFRTALWLRDEEVPDNLELAVQEWIDWYTVPNSGRPAWIPERMHAPWEPQAENPGA